MTAIFLDVETVPSQHPDARELARAELKPPGTLKKPESIQGWWDTEAESAAEAAYRKQALDPAQGELCAIGYALLEGEPQVSVRELGEAERAFLVRALRSIDELLARRFEGVDRALLPWADTSTFVIGHNVAFDLSFIRARGWANAVPVPRWVPGPWARPPKDYLCTMGQFAGPGGRISLDRLCKCLGVPSPKQGGDGSAVFDLWRSGAHDELAAYCSNDVQATRACWHIMSGVSGDPVAAVVEATA